MESIGNFLYDNWMPVWNGLLETVEPHLPEYLHWNELCWSFVFYLNEVRLLIHKNTRGLEHWEIVANTVTYCFYAFLLLEVLRRVIPFVFFNPDGFFTVVKKFGFQKFRNLPIVRDKVQTAIDKALAGLEKDGFQINGQSYIKKLPYNGLSPSQVEAEIKKYKEIGNDDWDDGYASGVIYAADKELNELMTNVYREFTWSNPLHADIFPDIRKMEAEVVRMAINMFNGNDECCGTMTSGGTESIVMACKAYREIAYSRGISDPEIVVPYSVHPAFDKACHYFGMRIKHTPVDKDGRADVKAMKRAINRRTILLVGSVPSYPHGCIDPMTEISKLAQKYNLYCHADCCFGGFLVPFMKKAGYHVPDFDFRLPGVTSISVDTHKYGYTPKGSSCILYNNKAIRKYQYFCVTNWSGGVYASPTLPGSRPGNSIATTWAAMMYHGEKGYVDRTRKVINATQNILAGLEKIPGIKIMSPVDVSIVAFTSDVFDVYLMSDELAKRRWHLNPLQFPSGIHIGVTMQHTRPGVVDRFVNDVRDVAKTLMKNPSQKAEGKGAIYGMSQQVSDRSIISDITVGFLDTYYSVTAGVKVD